MLYRLPYGCPIDSLEILTSPHCRRVWLVKLSRTLMNLKNSPYALPTFYLVCQHSFEVSEFNVIVKEKLVTGSRHVSRRPPGPSAQLSDQIKSLFYVYMTFVKVCQKIFLNNVCMRCTDWTKALCWLGHD